MIIEKKFQCTLKDIDSVIVELAKEIENGWHVAQIEHEEFEVSFVAQHYPQFSVTLVRKN